MHTNQRPTHNSSVVTYDIILRNVTKNTSKEKKPKNIVDWYANVQVRKLGM